jgi:hypothetical protein
MKLIILLLFSTIFFYNCSNKSAKEDIIYGVVKHYNYHQKSKNGVPPPPPPPPGFYGHLNFILMDSSKVFCHKRDFIPMNCMGDFDKPEKLSLTPDSLITINNNDLLVFLKKSISYETELGRGRVLSISSPMDTIRHRGFKIITDYLKANEIRRYVVRNWTEEEKHVSIAKNENKKYDSKKVKWLAGFSE